MNADGTGGRVGIDHSAWYLTIADFEALKHRLPDVEWQDTALLFETMRLIKSPAEQPYSRKAAESASAAMRATIDTIRDGVNEFDLMGTYYTALYKNGSEFPSLPPLINSGVRHTFAHALAAGNAVRPDEAVHLEIGASVKRYHAANLRVVYVGKAPKVFHDLFDLCRRAFDAALEKMQPVVPMPPGRAIKASANCAIAPFGHAYRGRSRDRSAADEDDRDRPGVR